MIPTQPQPIQILRLGTTIVAEGVGICNLTGLNSGLMSSTDPERSPHLCGLCFPICKIPITAVSLPVLAALAGRRQRGGSACLKCLANSSTLQVLFCLSAPGCHRQPTSLLLANTLHPLQTQQVTKADFPASCIEGSAVTWLAASLWGLKLCKAREDRAAGQKQDVLGGCKRLGHRAGRRDACRAHCCRHRFARHF